jgi:uncharacterized membrane protein
MTKVLVATFINEAKAKEAFSKLNEFDLKGDIYLYDKMMVRKLHNGDYETIKGGTNEGWRAFGGMAVGGLIGALGGPIGFIVGLYAGAVVGAVSEMNYYDFNDEFIKNIEKTNAPGMLSIIVEVEQEDVDFIEVSLNSFGAVIWQSDIAYKYDDAMLLQLKNLDGEILLQRLKLKEDISTEKDEVEKKIVFLRDKRNAIIKAYGSKTE